MLDSMETTFRFSMFLISVFDLPIADILFEAFFDNFL